MKLTIVFSISLKYCIRILMKIHWIYRFLLLQWLFYIVNHTWTLTIFLIFWYLLQFLSSKSWSYCHAGLSLSSPRYFILLMTIVKGGFPNFFFSLFIIWVEESHCLRRERHNEFSLTSRPVAFHDWFSGFLRKAVTLHGDSCFPSSNQVWGMHVC